MLRARVPVVKVVMFAPTVAVTTLAVKVALVERWMTNPVSLVALSTQVTVTRTLLLLRLEDSQDIRRWSGVAGTLTVAVLE